MLKIKDNVDLKELEKFGFEQKIESIGVKKGECYGYEADCSIDDEYLSIFIWADSRELCVDRDCEDILFDLIEAGLVEKVK